jgi:hypothetical protein
MSVSTRTQLASVQTEKKILIFKNSRIRADGTSVSADRPHIHMDGARVHADEVLPLIRTGKNPSTDKTTFLG